MIEFPSATKVFRRLPKEAFYKRLSLNKTLKDKFVSDVDRIVVENSLTKENLNLTKKSDIQEILLLSIALKKQEIDSKVIEAIARQNPHKLVFLLEYEGSRQLAVYHDKLYRTEWKTADEINLEIKGFSLCEIWNAFIEQIALHEESAKKSDVLSIDERLALQERILKLEKLIKKTEAAVQKERQPKKQFEMFSRLREYKKQLNRLKGNVDT